MSHLRSELPPMRVVVHVLRNGAALCGFGRGLLPGFWPAGHAWVSAEGQDVSKTHQPCGECAALAMALVPR